MLLAFCSKMVSESWRQAGLHMRQQLFHSLAWRSLRHWVARAGMTSTVIGCSKRCFHGVTCTWPPLSFAEKALLFIPPSIHRPIRPPPPRSPRFNAAQLRDALVARYPGARRALLKSGGDFPFLSRADEVNLHLQLHLRRCGAHRGKEFEEAERREMEEAEGEGEADRWSYRGSAGHDAARESEASGSREGGPAVSGGSSDAGPSRGAWQVRGMGGGAAADPLGGDMAEGRQSGVRQWDASGRGEGSAVEGSVFGDPLSVVQRGTKGTGTGDEVDARVSASPVWRTPASLALAAGNSGALAGPHHVGDDAGGSSGGGKQGEGMPWDHGLHASGMAWGSGQDDVGGREDDAVDSSGEVGSPDRDYMPMPGFTASPPSQGGRGSDGGAGTGAGAGPQLPHAQSSAREWLAMVEGEHYTVNSPSNGDEASESSLVAGSEQQDELTHVAQHLRLEESPLGH